MDLTNTPANVSSQTRSPLFALPGELRNKIYALVMTPSAQTVNPSWSKTIKPMYQQMPRLGVALLRTCHAVYLEADSSVLLKEGDFVFTRVAHIQAFASHLSMAQSSLIREITIDLREAASGDLAVESERNKAIANEWLHYLCCIHNAHPMGAWCSRLSTLRSDIPDIQSLCIDLTGWQPRFAANRLSGWKYLQSLLRKLRGLKSFTLKGKCLDSSSWNPRPVPWGLGPWISPALDKDDSALADLIGGVVREEQENELKILSWQTVDGITSLTVRIDDRHSNHSLMRSDRALLEKGSMLWQDFLEFKNGRSLSVKGQKLAVSARDVAPPVLPDIMV